jgi:hypothetical protein
MGLFGNKEEKAAQEAAAKAEAERLIGLPVADLAAELMPVFDSHGGKREKLNVIQVMTGLMSSYQRSSGHLKELNQPVREGLQALEHAALIEKKNIQGGAFCVSATRLGEEALADGSVRKYLASTSGS